MKYWIWALENAECVSAVQKNPKNYYSITN